MRKYENYKSHHLGWLSEVPAHWEVKKLKHLAFLKSGDSITAETINPEGTYPVFGGNGLRGYTESFTHDGHYVLIGRQGALCGNINYAKGTFFASEHALVALPRTEIETVWLGELLRIMNLGQYSQAAAQPGLSADRLQNLSVPVPPLPEQRAIAAYLDRKTAQLDTLLAQKEALLQKLHQKRQALINEAVTQGLDPEAPRKASGVAWLGDVPAHWKMRRLKRISPRIQVGLVINPSTYFEDDGVIPMLTARHVSPGKINADSASKISVESNKKLRETQIHEGDIVVVRVGYPGIASVVPPELDGVNCASMVIIRRGDFNSEFLAYCFNSQIGQTQVDLVAYGSAQKCFNIGEAREFSFPFPSADEQQAIVNFIETKTSEINKATAAIHTQIQTLKAYRQSLITEVVTGKVDVRATEPVAPEADLPLWMQ